ncbi:Rpn family recombination-promoting nuclease/putative transposase [Alkalinema sp. FACHB-956]|uniref:Rpn family recombination-promoting nuclease/putative transposase n=1 Tax=Alkalinema sp. FACHB-956 TaxID=2692768 RepID=UPI0016821515|nr:Rpn family recombination-promoting nuclease/putative transposase [Alkalinema sp. FACHB-956]MBD2330075.1 Rpn family recombination-promoting nuclease/putative transposase [Alkalinema sp. FACHB-956]
MFDNLSKFLIQQYSQDFAAWLLGEPIALTELKPTELSIEPIRADSVILLKSQQVIVHCEFQTNPDRDLPFRMADYALRIYRKYPDRTLVQVVVYLRETTSEWVYITQFAGNQLRHEFQVVRLWEQSPEAFLQRPGLLPYAVLTQTNDREALLREVARRLDEIPDRTERSNLTVSSAVIAGLSLEKTVIQRILRREVMRESVIYQEWETELKAEGRAEGQEEERRILAMKMLQEGLSLETIARITEYSLEQLEAIQTQINSADR